MILEKRMSKYRTGLAIIERSFANQSLRYVHNGPVKSDHVFNHNINSKRNRSLWNFVTGCGIGVVFGYGFWFLRDNMSLKAKETMKSIPTQTSCPMKGRITLAPLLANANPAVVCVRLIKKLDLLSQYSRWLNCHLFSNILLSEQSGFFVDHSGLTMTVGIDPSQFDNINIKTQDGRTFPATVVEYDTSSGLCLLKVIRVIRWFYCLILRWYRNRRYTSISWICWRNVRLNPDRGISLYLWARQTVTVTITFHWASYERRKKMIRDRIIFLYRIWQER